MKKRFWKTGLFLFLILNLVAGFHAWKFTHFASPDIQKTENAAKLGWTAKLKTLIFGVNNPRPQNLITPERPFQTVAIQSRKRLEAWYVPVDSSKGTVILFHGYSGCKSKMLEKGEVLNQLGFNTLLVDFAGSGGSEGNGSTIGYDEAEDVKASMDYLAARGEKHIVLLGTSMGAAAVLRAAKVYGIHPEAAILECPFGSMYATTCARFKEMSVPSFPMAGLLVFWGGTLNGFNAFGHNPSSYASSVDFPVLLMYGEKDREVSREETMDIFNHLKGKKQLKLFPEAGHDGYLEQYKGEWKAAVSTPLDHRRNI